MQTGEVGETVMSVNRSSFVFLLPIGRIKVLHRMFWTFYRICLSTVFSHGSAGWTWGNLMFSRLWSAEQTAWCSWIHTS